MIGVAGLGHMAVQILRALSPAQVIAVDTFAEKLRLAPDVGAEEAVMAGEGAAEAINDAMQGHSAELVIDMVGSDDTLARSLSLSLSLRKSFASRAASRWSAWLEEPSSLASAPCPSSASSPSPTGAARSS